MTLSAFSALGLGCFLGAGLAAGQAAPIELHVDMTDAGMHLAHVSEVLPVHAGENTFEYAQWIPGEHRATGPVAAVAGVYFRANGKELPWRRDTVDLYAIHVQVPAGVRKVTLTFDFLGPGDVAHPKSFGSRVGMLEMNTVTMYPAGRPVREIRITPSVKLPVGWAYGSALPGGTQDGNELSFGTVSVEQLIDSPVVMGAHCRRYPLAPEVTPKHALDVCAETETELMLPAETLAKFSNLAREAGALFGGYHYDHYDFLVAVSKNISGDSLEHHQGADYRVSGLELKDINDVLTLGYLFPHEYAHSWCGKYRRPIGLATPDYKTPMQNDLLWVYEGLTQYYGWVLAARSGFWTPDQFLGYVTFKLYNENGSPGRLWRSVQDTADGSAFLRGGAAQYSNWRRGQDYYDEGALIWMEADAKIRELTGGKKTLDDFAKGFFGGTTTWRVVPYTFADVVKALNAVAPYDWKGFWLTRLNSHAVDVPLGGPEAAGYRYVEKDEMSPLEKATVSPELFGDFWDSLGFTSFAKGEVYDVVWNSLAFRAGLAPDDTIAKVNGKDYTVAGLIEAVKAAKTGKDPIMLTVKREDAEMVVKLDYHGGEKYSWLVRDDGKADMFAELVRARASAAPPK